MNEIKPDRLRQVLDYDPESGEFRWEIKMPHSRVPVGAVAGCTNAIGYRKISVDGRVFAAHRLAWFYMHGVWPADQLDHINGIRSDNRIANLRESTTAENAQNRALSRSSSSQYPGVNWDKHNKRWLARIKIDGKLMTVGRFNDFDSAVAARKAAKAETHRFCPVDRI